VKPSVSIEDHGCAAKMLRDAALRTSDPLVREALLVLAAYREKLAAAPRLGGPDPRSSAT
jgi:hypothetical protein